MARMTGIRKLDKHYENNHYLGTPRVIYTEQIDYSLPSRLWIG